MKKVLFLEKRLPELEEQRWGDVLAGKRGISVIELVAFGSLDMEGIY